MSAGKIACGIFVAIVLFGCGSIKEYKEVSQPVSEVLEAGIGDTILTIKSEKSLPNAFGNADIFGRKTPTGLTTVQYLGSNGTLLKFVRQSVLIETGATTMNSSPIVIPNVQTTTTSGYVGTTPVYGSSTTYGSPTVIPAHPPKGQVYSQAPIAFEIDMSKQKEFLVNGNRIEILGVTPTSLTYKIDR